MGRNENGGVERKRVKREREKQKDGGLNLEDMKVNYYSRGCSP